MRPVTASSSYLSKLILCILLAIAIVNSYSSVFYFRLSMIPAFTPINNVIYKFLQPLLLLLGILFVLFFPLYWHRKKKPDTEKLTAWFTGVIRYWLALEISGYGFGKLFHLQFGESFTRNDSLVSQLSGFALTWNYFGYSYAMTVAIAFIQILGSILLLFRRSTLLGAILLFPVMFNIVLIDVFYGIPAGATRNAAFFTAGLLYLLLQHWSAFKAILFRPVVLPEVWKGGGKQLLRILVIGCSLAFVVYTAYIAVPSQPLAGKWEVMEMTRNNNKVPAIAWLTDSTAWKNIYIEHYRKITCSPNPYVIEEKRAQNGNYFTDTPHHIKIALFKRPTPIEAAISNADATHMQWEYLDGKDTVKLALLRVAGSRR